MATTTCAVSAAAPFLMAVDTFWRHARAVFAAATRRGCCGTLSAHEIEEKLLSGLPIGWQIVLKKLSRSAVAATAIGPVVVSGAVRVALEHIETLERRIQRLEDFSVSKADQFEAARKTLGATSHPLLAYDPVRSR